jgi:hypothetical protein
MKAEGSGFDGSAKVQIPKATLDRLKAGARCVPVGCVEKITASKKYANGPSARTC